jgi:hypothetical protein
VLIGGLYIEKNHTILIPQNTTLVRAATEWHFVGVSLCVYVCMPVFASGCLCRHILYFSSFAAFVALWCS